MFLRYLLLGLLLPFVCAAGPATQPAGGKVYEANGNLMQAEVSNGSDRLLAKEFCSAKHYRGDFRMCYAWIKDNVEDPTLMVLVCSREGKPMGQWELADSHLRFCTEVGKIQWLQEEKVAVVCRMKPENDLAIVFEMYSGRHFSYQGKSFAVDRNTLQTAYFRDAENGTTQIFINNRKIADLPEKSRGEFFWARDGKLLIAHVVPVEPANAPAKLLRIDLTDPDSPVLEWRPVKAGIKK